MSWCNHYGTSCLQPWSNSPANRKMLINSKAISTYTSTHVHSNHLHLSYLQYHILTDQTYILVLFVGRWRVAFLKSSKNHSASILDWVAHGYGCSPRQPKSRKRRYFYLPNGWYILNPHTALGEPHTVPVFKDIKILPKNLVHLPSTLEVLSPWQWRKLQCQSSFNLWFQSFH